ncbi:NAD-dependent epimerase/dehydratase family protein [Candidatus Kaiserbacteria bacterium]|nr:NAD-dependent epimerase/dehydratase family protein [Candidatus Kaiserbacteria bacterium]
MAEKSILVTGGAGFVGNALCKRLIVEGHKVISLDNYFTGSRENQVPGVEYREGHTKDIAKLVPEDIDLIYHLGEYARVEQSLSEPDLVWDLNIAGTHGVLEYWRARNKNNQKCKLVYAGSSTKFGDGGLARVATPYAWTKAANTELVKNYAQWYKLPFAITYFYNVYGPGERAGKYGTAIAIFMDLFAKGQPTKVTSPGTQSRNFTHIDDIVDGLVMVGEKGEGEEFGLGNETVYSMLDVAELFGTKIEMLPERPGNRTNSSLDTSKSKALGWTANRSLEDYIRDFTSRTKK